MVCRGYTDHGGLWCVPELGSAIPRATGDLKNYSTLLANVKRVQLYPDFLLSPSVVAAVLCMRILEPAVFCCDSAVETEAADISALLQTIAAICRQVRQLSWTGHYTTDLNFASALAAVLTTSTCMPRVLPETLACCRRLTWLEVECYSLSDSQMLPLVVSAHRLECYSVHESTDLTDACLAALSETEAAAEALPPLDACCCSLAATRGLGAVAGCRTSTYTLAACQLPLQLRCTSENGSTS
jgi:hypothetical protein